MTIEEKNFGKNSRRYVILISVFVLMCILFYRLYDIQFIRADEYGKLAERNAVRKVSRDPSRGLIYDRDHNIIVDNNPSYTLTVTPFEYKWESFPALCQMFNLDSSAARFKILMGEKIAAFEPVKIAHDIPFELIAFLEENKDKFPGVNYVIDSKRVYNLKPRLAHLLGYIREINLGLLEKKKEYYKPGDLLGYIGIEAFYEEILRGRKGFGFFTVNAKGKVIESFDHGKSDIPSVEGADIVLTLDLKLQEYVEHLLRGKRAALVAMDPNNGEVLAFASSPDYDLKYFSGKTPVDVFSKLISDKNKPFFNRASQAAYAPGSTFKMMLASAALQEGIISESSTLNCPGSFYLSGVQFKCHGAHGNINVTRAIEQSCNVFFYQLIFKLGFKNWSRYGSMFHFGRKTGMDIADENPGILPSEDYYNKRYGYKKWNKGYLVSLSIGQGELNTTPLQMAAYTTALANGGTYFFPHVVRAVIDRTAGGERMVPIRSEKILIDAWIWKIIQKGMRRVVTSGTGTAAQLGGIEVAGKTGTAENFGGRDHAWFIGYAPYRDPKIAVALIVENGGFGGDAAAPLAAAALAFYIRGGLPPPIEPEQPLDDGTHVEVIKNAPPTGR